MTHLLQHEASIAILTGDTVGLTEGERVGFSLGDSVGAVVGCVIHNRGGKIVS